MDGVKHDVIGAGEHRAAYSYSRDQGEPIVLVHGGANDRNE